MLRKTDLLVNNKLSIPYRSIQEGPLDRAGLGTPMAGRLATRVQSG